MTRTLTITQFNGQRFEHTETTEAASGKTSFSYAIDGVQVEKAEWTIRQDAAIERDLKWLLKRAVERRAQRFQKVAG